MYWLEDLCSLANGALVNTSFVEASGLASSCSCASRRTLPKDILSRYSLLGRTHFGSVTFLADSTFASPTCRVTQGVESTRLAPRRRYTRTRVPTAHLKQLKAVRSDAHRNRSGQRSKQKRKISSGTPVQEAYRHGEQPSTP